MKPSIWIILLNWNGLEDTLDCLASLDQADMADVELQTIVIDNCSRTDPSNDIQQRFPTVKTVRLGKNFGFAGGCNYGISLALSAKADYVLLLNNDTYVEPNFLKPLLAYHTTHPRTGIIAPLICYADDPDRIWFGGGTIVMSLGYFEGQHRRMHRQSIPNTPMLTDHVTGCCMLIPTSVLEEIGGFDERLFAFLEDTDLCIRAHQHGYDIVCVPESIIWHKVSSSTRREFREGSECYVALPNCKESNCCSHETRKFISTHLLFIDWQYFD